MRKDQEESDGQRGRPLNKGANNDALMLRSGCNPRLETWAAGFVFVAHSFETLASLAPGIRLRTPTASHTALRLRTAGQKRQNLGGRVHFPLAPGAPPQGILILAPERHLPVLIEMGQHPGFAAGQAPAPHRQCKDRRSRQRCDDMQRREREGIIIRQETAHGAG